MKDEIKEILELFGSTDENIMFGDIVELNSKQSHLLLDYITNLQEENERLKELDENYPIEEQLEEALKYENIYKLRNEKAIEYINNYFVLGVGSEYVKKLTDILQGNDKD